MSKNIYDIFRDVQEKKTACYDKRSANFIIEGALSINITHVRKNKSIQAAIVFNHKEGPDEAIVYTLKSDQLLKTDYFVYNNVYYLVYEDNKSTDDTQIYKKQKAVECNINFTVGSTIFNAYFLSALRRSTDTTLERTIGVVDNQKPLVIVPTNSLFTIGLIIKAGGRPWRIMDYDNISNAGITYLYVEPAYSEHAEPSAPELPDDDPELPDDEPEEEVLTLSPMVEYTFDTKDAFFASNPKVQIISRSKLKITFVVPYGIDEVVISTKDEAGEIIQTLYRVVI